VFKPLISNARKWVVQFSIKIHCFPN